MQVEGVRSGTSIRKFEIPIISSKEVFYKLFKKIEKVIAGKLGQFSDALALKDCVQNLEILLQHSVLSEELIDKANSALDDLQNAISIHSGKININKAQQNEDCIIAANILVESDLNSNNSRNKSIRQSFTFPPKTGLNTSHMYPFDEPSFPQSRDSKVVYAGMDCMEIRKHIHVNKKW